MVTWAKIPTGDLTKYLRDSLRPERAIRAELDPYYAKVRAEMVSKAYKELARRRRAIPDRLVLKH